MRVSAGPVRICARQSDLARLQAYRVGGALKSKLGLEIEYAFRESLGDVNQNDPLWKMPEKGVFTEDFIADLRDGRADLVVHSWKDLPTEPRTDTLIAATMPRADARDLLLFRGDRLASARASGKVRILTSSPRRTHNLKNFLSEYLPFRNEAEFVPVRGNIPTRLKKLFSQDADGLIVAKAALDRLLEAQEPEFNEVRGLIRELLARVRFMVLPLTVNPTAAAQGALAIEVSRKRPDLLETLRAIHCEQTYATVERERRLLASYGGGCHQKIGVTVLRRPYGDITFLRGLTDAGETLDRVALEQERPLFTLALNERAIFPRAGEAPEFFKREALPRSSWERLARESYLWVARENAWPDGLTQAEGAIVWCAGLKTWKKLAERGVWVTGSAESLGEDEPTRLETLVGNRAIDWVKLTHESAAAAGAAQATPMRACATYRLLPSPGRSLDLKGRSHFFWSSGSSFDRAVAEEPSLRMAYHACGPGSTFRYLREKLGSEAEIGVFLSIEDWRRAVLQRARPR